LQCVAVCCSVLQCVTVYCSVLQSVAVCCSVLHCVAVCCSVLQCVTVCYSVLQCVAVYCSVLQCIAVCCSALQSECFQSVFSVLQWVTACHAHYLPLVISRTHDRTLSLTLFCSFLNLVVQCVAACCSVLQCVVQCCSVLQCVAVCGAFSRPLASLGVQSLSFPHIPHGSHLDLNTSPADGACHVILQKMQGQR